MDQPLTQPACRFRHTNVDLQRYVDGCRARARKLRREAELLVTRAEVIEIEADMLSVELIVVADV